MLSRKTIRLTEKIDKIKKEFSNVRDYFKM